MKSILNTLVKTAFWLLFLVDIFITILVVVPPKIKAYTYSNVVYDRNNKLLQASIAKDGQWRFPELDSIPSNFETALIQFEDKRYYRHFGVDLIALARATFQNLRSNKITSGGSTLSMQLARIDYNLKTTSILGKLNQALKAFHLELHFSKKDLLKRYISLAPFGSNVVGIEAAAWRYYGRSSNNLTWAEAATLAVLPNAPGLIFPGRANKNLEKKRNFLLAKLKDKGLINREDYLIALQEPIPNKPKSLPQKTPHLAQFISKNKHLYQSKTSIDADLQQRVQEIANRHVRVNAQNEIMNVAVLVADINSMEVLAYVGNHTIPELTQYAGWVDNIHGKRSTGSVLKPLLYASAMDDSKILPNSIIEDIPTNFSGYAPKNYDKIFRGAVSASVVVARSLNVPSVRLLYQYSLQKFHRQLQRLGLHSINKPASYYGLSLILGGAEESLWNLCATYASLAKGLQHFLEHHSYPNNAISTFHLSINNNTNSTVSSTFPISAGSLYYMFEAMQDVHRPDEEKGWQYFNSSQKIAYKTGTSFGYRDAWAIGLNGDYIVGVWVGNSSGEGRDGLTGVQKAAPILFETFKQLSQNNWFSVPYDNLIEVSVCVKSGLRSSVYCNETAKEFIPLKATRTSSCKFHRTITVDTSETYRVDRSCTETDNIKQVNWFVLPPVAEWYFKNHNPWYKSLPPIDPNCKKQDLGNMRFIYPENFARIKIPIELDGQKGAVIFKLAHRQSSTKVYWFLDNTYLGETQNEHSIEAKPLPGTHNLRVVDENGEIINHSIYVIN